MDPRGSRPSDRAGLCASCAHAAVITSSRGAIFYLCELSRTDPAFVRYPALPVLACRGYTPASKRRPEDLQ